MITFEGRWSSISHVWLLLRFEIETKSYDFKRASQLFFVIFADQKTFYSAIEISRIPLSNFIPRLSLFRAKLYANGERNVVAPPPNCPSGQQWINGQCRDVWSLRLPHNTVTVPPNCPPGQEYINGVCREVWNGDARSIL